LSRVTVLASGPAAMLALALLGALSDTASAAVPGLQRAVRSTLADSQPAKDRPVRCPTGTKMISGGGSVSGGFGQVVLDGIRLNSALNNVTTRAFEDANGTNLNWSLNAYAMCANPLPGLVQVDSTTASTSFAKSAIRGLPSRQAGRRRGRGDDLTPSSDHTRVTATGFETEGGTSDNWSITAHAMCADPLPGLEVRALQSDFGSFDGQTVTESCSAGKKVVGAGGEITGGLGQVVMDGITPNAGLTSVTVDAHEVGSHTDNNWNLTGYAICATP
jgi:hypothetical protein